MRSTVLSMLEKMRVGRRQTLERRRVAAKVGMLAWFAVYTSFGERKVLFIVPFEPESAPHPPHESPNRARISIAACHSHAP